jgi:hypothetical protein
MMNQILDVGDAGHIETKCDESLVRRNRTNCSSVFNHMKVNIDPRREAGKHDSRAIW